MKTFVPLGSGRIRLILRPLPESEAEPGRCTELRFENVETGEEIKIPRTTSIAVEIGVDTVPKIKVEALLGELDVVGQAEIVTICPACREAQKVEVSHLQSSAKEYILRGHDKP